MKGIKKILFILLLISGLIITYLWNRQTGNYSLFYGYSFVVGLIIYIIVLFILVVIDFIKYWKTKNGFNFSAIIITLIFICLNLTLSSSFIRGKTVMEGMITNYLFDNYECSNQIKHLKYPDNHTFIVSIDFKDNQKCIISLAKSSNSGLRKSFSYHLDNDTLTFDGNNVQYTDSIMTKRYLINYKSKICLPLDKGAKAKKIELIKTSR